MAPPLPAAIRAVVIADNVDDDEFTAGSRGLWVTADGRGVVTHVGAAQGQSVFGGYPAVRQQLSTDTPKSTKDNTYHRRRQRLKNQLRLRWELLGSALVMMAAIVVRSSLVPWLSRTSVGGLTKARS